MYLRPVKKTARFFQHSLSDPDRLMKRAASNLFPIAAGNVDAENPFDVRQQAGH